MTRNTRKRTKTQGGAPAAAARSLVRAIRVAAHRPLPIQALHVPALSKNFFTRKNQVQKRALITPNLTYVPPLFKIRKNYKIENIITTPSPGKIIVPTSESMSNNTIEACPAGSQCSVSGKTYERLIAATCRKVKSPYLAIPFNTQEDAVLGGSSADIDITLNWRAPADIGVEAKRPTPDWMQMKLQKNQDGAWVGVENAKIPKASKAIFEAIIGSTVLFGGKTPTFLERSMKYNEWTAIKAANPEFGDTYITCSPDTISDLYRAKGCQYIQVANKGLYHTGIDTCNFGVPYFRCDQRIRIRIKVHSSGVRQGKNAALSVTAAAQPVSIKELPPSPFSLDNSSKLPPQLLPLTGA
jgi:hypothetical protein